jgi:hypothetical protein
LCISSPRCVAAFGWTAGYEDHLLQLADSKQQQDQRWCCCKQISMYLVHFFSHVLPRPAILALALDLHYTAFLLDPAPLPAYIGWRVCLLRLHAAVRRIFFLFFLFFFCVIENEEIDWESVNRRRPCAGSGSEPRGRGGFNFIDGVPWTSSYRYAGRGDIRDHGSSGLPHILPREGVRNTDTHRRSPQCRS